MRLSVITINYNNRDGLQKTMESVLSQSFTDYEYIVMDGASTDGSADLRSMMPEGRGTFVSEPDKGIYNAMNKGIARAKGDYLLFMNSGDVFASETCVADVFSQVAEDAASDILYCNALLMWQDREPELLPLQEKLTLAFLTDSSLCHQATFIPRQLLVDCGGYDESYKIVSDWKQWLVWLWEGKTFRYIPTIVCHFDTCGLCADENNYKRSMQERWDIIHKVLPPVVVDTLVDYDKLWMDHRSFQNKPCLQTRDYCAKSHLYRRIIRSVLHLITWIDR